MRAKTWRLPAAVGLVAAAVIAVVIVSAAGGDPAGSSPSEAPVSTAKVQRGDLSDSVSQSGVLSFRAQRSGAPFIAINQAHGVYTKLPENGEKVDCGRVLYRVDERPVLLLCGAVPAYRDLHAGDVGQDVRALNATLHRRGAGVDPVARRFTARTRRALEALQRDTGAAVTGTLGLGDAVFLPESVRIAKVTAQIGAPARPGAPILTATSSTPEVQMNLDPSQQNALHKGDRAQITLPTNTSTTGRVDRIGAVVQTPAGQGSAPSVTIPVYVRLDQPAQARGLDQAPVQVDITTKGVRDALSVPVTALVGQAGGGFAVEVVRAGGQRELVSVQLGLFDSADGRVQVEGQLRAGDDVAVPSL